MKETIDLTLNGKPVKVTTDSNRMLLWVLRTDLHLTGTKYGCGENYCGACTVLVENEATRSCHVTLKDVRGKNVVTIEGLAKRGSLHPLQKAFADHNALQCGYCTPGMIMTAVSLLHKNPTPTPSEILEGMNDNLCRCAAHNRIVQAIESVSTTSKGGI
ncbi:MAG: (2Fe-2S)-binding protein [Ignavibacteria bacterium]|nr:(2Fe-2S)-binding protein [Ignavibacteria bacterium]